jgi:spermidine/putrescine transport system substrate-binding protein
MSFINYVYNPVNSAKIVKAAPYISPVKGTTAELARIAPELASSPLVSPPADLRARLHIFRGLDDAEDQEFSRIFQDAMGA